MNRPAASPRPQPSAPAPGPAIAWVDLSGCLVAVTPEVGALYGYPAGTMVGQPAAIVLPEERRPVLGEILETIRRGVSVPPYLGLHRHRDGTELPVEVTATPALDADGAVTGMVIALRDLRLEVPARALEGSQSLGQLVGAAGALAFQLDQRVSPPAWFLCGDRSLIGLEGKSQTLTPLMANASTEPVRATLEALVAEVLGDRPGGSRVSTVIPPGRTQRWLAARAVVAEGAPSAPLRVCGMLVDVTDQYMTSEGERQEVPAAPTFVARISLGAERRLEYVSGSAYHFTGYTPQELLEGGLERLRGCLDRSLSERFEQERESGAIDGGSYEYRTFRRDGSSLWVRTEIRVVEGEHGEDVLEVTAFDVHQTKLVELEVSRLLLIDALTGLASRRGLEQAWEERCAEGAARMAGEAEAEVPQAWAVLAQIDIDRFGVVNAGLGMVAGDEMLRVIGERLSALAGEGATVARMGADDFVVLASGLATMTDAYALALQLVGAGAEPVRIGARDVYSTVSVGATLLDQRAFGSGARVDERLAEAHVALRAAKARNGNCVELFAEGMRAAAQSNIETHSALRHGIEAHQFVLHYQPIVDLETREVLGAEALVRWQHPTRGLLLPSEFIPLAEETGAIVELGDYVIEEACRAAARWPAGPRGELTVAVNLSARQLLSPELVTRISRALESSGLAPERLVLEITETSVIYDLDGAGWTLRLLAEMGVHFALDDFGTGYSSLAYLVQLPIDRVKVDRSLVAGLPHTSGSQAVIAGVVGMTRAMGFHAIAEGVETEDQIDALNGLACHLAQGFLFSPPVSEQRFLRLATRQSPVG